MLYLSKWTIQDGKCGWTGKTEAIAQTMPFGQWTWDPEPMKSDSIINRCPFYLGLMITLIGLTGLLLILIWHRLGPKR